MPKDASGHLIPGRLSPTRPVPDGHRPSRVRRQGGTCAVHRRRLVHARRRAAHPCGRARRGRRHRGGRRGDPPRRDHRRARPHRARLRRRARRVPVDARLPRLPEVLVHLGQRGHLPRHTRRHGARRRRPREPRRDGLPRRVPRRPQPDLRGRATRARRCACSSSERGKPSLGASVPSLPVVRST